MTLSGPTEISVSRQNFVNYQREIFGSYEIESITFEHLI